MSTDDTSTQESDDKYQCAVDGCEYTNGSKHGLAAHFGIAHDEEVKREAYLDEIKRLADSLGRTPRQEDMEEHGRFGATAYGSTFGSWNEALAEIGLEPNVRRDIPTEDLIDEIHRLKEELGRTPMQEEMGQKGKYHQQVYQSRFGSWNKAIERVGIKPNKCSEVSEEELLDALHQLAEELGHAPSYREMDKYGEHSASTYVRRFGSWNEPIRELGYDGTNVSKIPREDLIDEVRRLLDEIDRVPRQKDMNQRGAYSTRAYYRVFGSWNKALREIGLDLNKELNASDEDLLNEILRLRDELDTVPRADDMNERGDYSAATYSNRFGTWSEAVREAGLEPNTASDWVLCGPEHPHYKDGGGRRYYGPNWREQRQRAIECDEKQCTQCDLSRVKQRELWDEDLHVHHKRPLTSFPFVDDNYNRDWESVNALSNLLTCCTGCHRGLDKKAWERYPPDEYPRHIVTKETTVEITQTTMADFN